MVKIFLGSIFVTIPEPMQKENKMCYLLEKYLFEKFSCAIIMQSKSNLKVIYLQEV